jgi:hypothetical protein
VSAGSEPERDDTGLPPVDIEIPDDARDLDRDVQAYYRELRANRREQRGRRVRGSLARDGVVLPLLACCLILALITGTLLTVFTATSDRDLTGGFGGNTITHPPASSGARSGAASTGARAQSTSPPASTKPTESPVRYVERGAVPATTIRVDGRPFAVQGLRPAAVVLIPAGCNCTAAVRWLIGVASGAHASTYLVYTARSQTTVLQTYGQLTAGQRAQAVPAFEPDTTLTDSVPTSLRANTLTAIMLGPTKVVYATALGSGHDPTVLIQALTH